ncbi:MAG: S8 family peptidase, partial [Saprospiraceae bacterium]|nr:S8 family peptidase [Saprospiraceae bacterium]
LLDKPDSLLQKGITLEEFRGGSTYFATLPTTVTPEDLAKLGVIKVETVPTNRKLAVQLKDKTYPSWSMLPNGKIKVAIAFAESLSNNEMKDFLDERNISILSQEVLNNHIFIVQLSDTEIPIISEQPFVKRIEIANDDIRPLMTEARGNSKLNVLNSNIDGQRNLNGSGVTIGIGDGGTLGGHIDIAPSRLLYMTPTYYATFGVHPDVVTSIAGGAGIIQPRNRGVAPLSSFVIDNVNLIIDRTPTYRTTYNMVLTNNSYGGGADCSYNGEYNYTSNILDKQLYTLADVLHLFASGNSGELNCSPYPVGYNTVLSAYQSAKNVLTVGNSTDSFSAYSQSSKGPTKDGRIKPEVVITGTSITTAGRFNDYFTTVGTSAATPIATGTAALMVERYRQLSGGTNPAGGLIKAILCNSADDISNPHPDFATGFGVINGKRAVETIEANRYTSSTISTGATNNHTINVPSGQALLKIMLYWVDKEGDPAAAIPLVNNLDLEVVTPSGTTFLPWILNTTPANVTDIATRGVDNLNNIEQVTLDNPETGNYTIRVKGMSIPSGSQKYYITYDIVSPNVTVTFPYGGEALVPGEIELIQWEAPSNGSNTFKIEYSINNGASWNTLSNDVASSLRNFSWQIPSSVTTTALVRVTQNVTGLSDVSEATFSILNTPTNFTATAYCGSAAVLNWSAVTNATEYNIYQYNGETMNLIATTNLLGDTIFGLTSGTKYWFAVDASVNGVKCRRANAISVTPSVTDGCPAEAGLSNLHVSTIIGRQFTSTALKTDEPILVTLNNNGGAPLSPSMIYYKLNNGAAVSQNSDATINAQDSAQITFTEGANLNAVGTYNLDAWVSYQDFNPANDSIIGQIVLKQLANPVITLPYTENFNSTNIGIFNSTQTGIQGNDAIDVLNTSYYQSEIFYVNGSYQNSLRVSAINNATTEEGVRMTVNLSNYNTNTNNVTLSLNYRTTGALISNQIYVRGSDTDVWVPLETLSNNLSWQNLSNISITTILRNANQQFSSSFQLLFPPDDAGSYTLDNINFQLGAALPVEYNYFTANKINNDAILKWETDSEKNCLKYEIQVSSSEDDTVNGRFRTIGTVDGHGTTNLTSKYQFIDSEVNKFGKRYYRLKQFDSDLSFSYSEIRFVHFNENTTTLISAFPNPTSEYINLHFSTNDYNATNIQLIDIQGKIVAEKQVSLGDENQIYFETKLLSSGNYFFKITDSKNMTTIIPVIKAKD